MPRTVLLLITTFDMGGAERVYIQLARGLVERGYRVVAACLQGRSWIVGRQLESHGVTTVDLRMSSALDVGVIARVLRLIRHERVDVVYTFLIHSHLVGRLAAKLGGVPVVLSSQQTMLYESRFFERANRITARWCDKVVAVSRNVEAYLADNVGVPRDKLTTIYNSVDAKGLSVEPGRSRRESPVIGCCARLTPEKDHRGLIRAVKILRSQFPGIRLSLAGDGPERNPLVELVREEGLEDTVEFLGQIDDVAAFYAGLDVYVQSSYVEGLPCSVLEALACALPVVVTRVGGNGEIVRDGTSGRLVPPGDPPALADAIAWMLHHPEDARRMGMAGRTTVRDRFSTEAMIEATDVLITRELEKKMPLNGTHAGRSR